MTFTISLTTSRRMQFYYMKNTQNVCDDLGEKRITRRKMKIITMEMKIMFEYFPVFIY